MVKIALAVYVAVHALFALFFLYPANAQEQVLAEATHIQGGLICNTQDEVHQAIKLSEQGKHLAVIVQEIDGCGVLTRPALAKVTAVEKHSAEKGNYLIVRFDFLELPHPPQYGIHAFVRHTSL